ncbi:MAG: extracellular solute-binding protein [Proteobacteria bacterium]|nr:MAG: extracellular solute-binding protein [Pseudomonadota bacterium]
MILSLLIALFSVNAEAAEQRLHLWHQMIYSQREVLRERLNEFEKLHPGVRVISTYRETEELRSSFQAAALGGSGPELIYGPSDAVGPLATMGLLTPLETEGLEDFDPKALVRFKDQLFAIGDTVGNHLMLIYNRKLLPKAPETTDELIRVGKELTKDTDGDGRIDQYGMAWNFTEPFFFVPWISGFGGTFFELATGPHLDTEAVQNAFSFVKDLRDKHRILPRESDYETANALFKEGRTAMLINGDWSWGDYKKAGMDFGIAPFPKVSSTGLWPQSLIGTKAYSLNANTTGEKKALSMELMRFLTNADTQMLYAKRLSSLPSRISVRNDPALKDDPLLVQSVPILAKGSPMPIVPEARAVWDALRGPYQSLLGGDLSAKDASTQAQALALQKIRELNEVPLPGKLIWITWAIIGVCSLLCLYGVVRLGQGLVRGLMGPQKLAYIFLLPAFISIFAVILFPFLFNIAISMSNFSLRTFRAWEIIGFANYLTVLSDSTVLVVLLRTLLWTFLNVTFHVSIGVALALLMNEALPARPIFRTLLIIPWAVPQYITALTWRAMFHQEYGPVNQVLERLFHMSPIQWLSRPWEAFFACVITNVWLGFPFMMVVALGGLQSIPKTLYEAARVDGATAFQRFRHITLPLLKPVMAPAAVLGGIWTFNNLNVIWLVTNGGEPSDQTHILVSYVYKAAFNQYRYAYGAAMSLIIFLVLAGATLYSVRKSNADERAY